MLQAFVIMLDTLKFKAGWQKIFIHDLTEAIENRFHRFGSKTLSRFVLVNDVVGGFRPRVIQNGLNLNLAAHTL